MKHLKMLGLALAAAAAVMAFIGAASASATVICENNQTFVCTSKQSVGTIHSFSLVKESTGTLVTTGGNLEMTCSGSTVQSELVNAGSATTTPVTQFKSAGLAWSGCTNTVKSITGGEGEVHNVSGTDNGTGTLKGIAVTTLVGGLDCAYGAGTGIDLGVFKPGVEGKDGIINLNIVIQRNSEHSSPFCAQDMRYLASYTQTTTTPIYIAAS